MNNATNTTVQNTIDSTEIVNIAELTAQLELIERLYKDPAYSDSSIANFTYAELSNTAYDLNIVLENLLDQSNDEQNISHIESAQAGLHQVLNPTSPTQTMANRRIVAILMLGLDAMRAVQEENNNG